MATSCDDTDVLIERATQGDEAARERLLERYRSRLKQMVALRIDRRLAPRLDPSDIVQDALADATLHLDEFLRTRPLPVYLWLRRLTWERLVHAHRRHIKAGRRSVTREQHVDIPPSDDSMAVLADRFVGKASSPSNRLIRDEQYQRVLAQLRQLRPRDREILVLVYLEQLSTQEIAGVLGITQGAVMSRHTRSLLRLRERFDAERSEES